MQVSRLVTHAVGGLCSDRLPSGTYALQITPVDSLLHQARLGCSDIISTLSRVSRCLFRYSEEDI